MKSATATGSQKNQLWQPHTVGIQTRRDASMMLTIYILHTRIGSSCFLWRSLEAALMALQPVLSIG